MLIDMKSNKNTESIPVIILSNLGQESDIQRGLALGAKDYLVKTEVSLSEVIEKAREQLVRAR